MAPTVLVARVPPVRATSSRPRSRGVSSSSFDTDRYRLREYVAEQLASAGCVAADEEADELLESAPDDRTLDDWIRRRRFGEPLAWITGALTFCGNSLRIHPGVYVPRLQSEELARRGASRLAASGGRAADICTGAGAIAAHLRSEVPDAVVVGVDIDPRAIACAQHNGVPSVLGDLAEPLRSRAFDVLIAVAPYVPTEELRLLPRDVQRFEPHLALDGGRDGLAVVREIVDSAARVLRPGGGLLLELGGEQDRALGANLVAAGFAQITVWCDEEGDLRGLEATLIRGTT